MATYSMTIANGLRVFGPDMATPWGDSEYAQWGTMLWGYTQDVVIGVSKVIGNTITTDSQVNKSPVKIVGFGSVALDYDMSSESVYNGPGWQRVFIGPAVDAEDRAITTWTASPSTTQTYTSSTASSITWSEA